MERRRFAAFCAAALCFWLFALAFGSAQGFGLRAVLAPDGAKAETRTAIPTLNRTEAPPTVADQPSLQLNCRAAVLVVLCWVVVLGGGAFVQFCAFCTLHSTVHCATPQIAL